MNKVEFKDVFDIDESYILRVLAWRNQEFVRSKMVSKDIISEKDHLNYMGKLVGRDDNKIFVGFINGEAFGIVTCKVEDTNIDYGYYLVKEELLGMGFGMLMEYFSIKYVFDNFFVDKIKIKVLDDNKKVISLHKKFGFKVSGNITFDERSFVTMTLEKDIWEEKKERHKKIINKVFNVNTSL
ncbi:MAG: GNAT family N-acetyltransferase [Firmicutes bacterium]|jgi:RimJ/RimL family protein N-acetyltransferase|nr:GNAT family N-acetyltransferase [Bacillota bacterium]